MGQDIKAVLKMRRKGRGTQTDAKEVTSHCPQAYQCLLSLQRGYCGKAKPPVEWLSLAACTELRSRESLDTLQALFCNTSNTAVLSAQFYLQAGKVQVAMTQLTPSQPAPPHSFISKSSLFFFFPPPSPVQLFAVFFLILLHHDSSSSLIASSL